MNSLVLHPTAVAQWHALINDAQHTSQVLLNEELESYLVFLLVRFAGQPQMAQSVLALEFLESVSEAGRRSSEKLQEVGDKCLLFSGLFPGRAKKRRVEISYFVDLGQSAYATFANHAGSTISPLFTELSLHFVALMSVLHATRLPLSQLSKAINSTVHLKKASEVSENVWIGNDKEVVEVINKLMKRQLH